MKPSSRLLSAKLQAYLVNDFLSTTLSFSQTNSQNRVDYF